MILAYGYPEMSPEVYSCPFSFMCQTTLDSMRDSNHICVSMMSQSHFTIYRDDIQYKIEKLQGNDLSTKEFQHYRKILALSYDITTARSLKELSRLQLHHLVPSGRLPQYVHHLRINQQQKNYLSLGIQPL